MIVENESNKEVTKQNNSSANYSSLFDTYSCDITIAELAKVLQIPESDIVLGENQSAEHCVFKLKGFGKGYENMGSQLRFGPSFSTKKQNKKVITNHLKEKKEMPNGMIMGRDILLADAGDCYITFQPLQGRVLILNENYERLFMISYGSKASTQNRTKAQHDDLTQKIKNLANLLVTKHKNQ